MRGSAAPSPTPSATTGDRPITIENEVVVMKRETIPLSKIVIDPTNPRIQHQVRQHFPKKVPTHDELSALIQEEPGFPELFKRVRDNGGLQEEIYVRADGRVAEGNCRAACYLKLHKANTRDVRWQAIPALRLPDTITERQVAILQGQHHVAGKTKWRAYEKAGHIYTMNKVLNVDAKAIAKALGMQERVVLRLIQQYEVMTKKLLPRMKSGSGLDKWSHIDEFFKRAELEDARQDPKKVEEFLDLVATDKLKQGVEVRNLSKIWKNKKATRALKKDGVPRAMAIVGKADPTADSPVFRKMKELAQCIRQMSAQDLRRLSEEKKAQQLVADLFNALKLAAKTARLRLG